MRRQATDWETIFAKDTSDKGLSSKVYKELLGRLGGSVSQTTFLAQDMISGSWDRAPCWALCSAGVLPLPLTLPLCSPSPSLSL